MHYLEVACRLLLAAVFLTAAVTKLSGGAAWAAFTDSLRQLDQVPGALVRPAALAVVAAEAIAGVLLLVPVRAAGRVGFVLAGGLLLAFILVIGRALSSGNRAPCRCFGASSTPLGAGHLVRNVVLLGAALLGLAGTFAAGPLGLPYALVAGAAGLVAGILITAFEDIVALLK